MGVGWGYDGLCEGLLMAGWEREVVGVKVMLGQVGMDATY